MTTPRGEDFPLFVDVTTYVHVHGVDGLSVPYSGKGNISAPHSEGW
jgi:hypothetical protein